MEVDKACVIANPNSGSQQRRDALKEILEKEDGFDWWISEDEESALELTQRAIREDYGLIAIAGGDGTINAVVNAMMEEEADIPLGLLPVGTGNDLARTLAVPLNDMEDMVRVLRMRNQRRIDVLRLESGGETRFGINVAAGGFSGQVDERVTSEMKEDLGPLAYVFGAATALPDLKEFETHITVDEGPRERIDTFNIIVANGRTVGGGKRVAPAADPCDGMLDVVIVEECNLLAMANIGTLLVTGNYTDSEFVRHFKAKRIEVSSTPGMWFNIDGELLTKESITFTIIPQALTFLVGPEFREKIED